MKNTSTKYLKSIFEDLEQSLFENSFDKRLLVSTLKPFRNVKFKKQEDDWYYRKVVEVTFYSGFKAQTVSNKLENILNTFKSISHVSKWSKEKLAKVYNQENIIKNKQKIDACWKNAKVFNDIIQEFGSFYKYLESYGDLSSEKVLEKLRIDLINRFFYIGDITSYHFMTDLGLNVVKPDRVLVRIFQRLGLIHVENNDSEKTNYELLEIAREISRITGNNIRYVDIIFVLYGQVSSIEMGIKSGICLEKKPLCHLCSLQKHCNYYKKKSN